MNTRQTKILDMLNERGEVVVGELADQLGVTTMTIRRDLSTLEREGNVIRTHGGAVLSNAGIVEFAFKQQGERCAREKQAIAREIAKEIEPGMTVSLDTGTTTLEVAHAIASVRGLRVLTSSLVIASALYARDNVELVLLGGRARHGNPDLFGWLTEENLRHFRADVAVLGADGADQRGVYTFDESVGRVSSAMYACANTTILALDHTKLGNNAFWCYAKWQDIDYVVTDAGADASAKKWVRRVSNRVHFAHL